MSNFDSFLVRHEFLTKWPQTKSLVVSNMTTITSRICTTIHFKWPALLQMMWCLFWNSLNYSQGRLRNRSLISGGQMQIITQCLLSLPPYSALWVHTLFPSHSALWGRRECELSCNLHLAPKNKTALDYYYLDALGCSHKLLKVVMGINVSMGKFLKNY